MKLLLPIVVSFLIPHLGFGQSIEKNIKLYDSLIGQKFEKINSKYDFDNDGIKYQIIFSLTFIDSNEVWGHLEVKSKKVVIWSDVYKLSENGTKDPNFWSAEPKNFILSAKHIKQFVAKAFDKSMYSPTIHTVDPRKLNIDELILSKHHLCNPVCEVNLMKRNILTSKRIHTIWYRNFDRESFNELAYSSHLKYMAVINQGDY